MDFPVFSQEMLRWAVGLLVGFPLAMLLMGEAILRLRRHNRPIVTTLTILRSLVLPTLAALLLLMNVVGLPRGHAAVRVVETVMWIFLIHAALSFVNDVVFASAAEGSWQSRFPKLFLDLVRLILVLIGACVVLSTVWGADLTKLAAALGVGSIVIGLALQEPLGNVFAGMMLLFERPIAVGDWIQIDGTTGKVVQITWRSVHIETGTRELRIVPNSSLYKGSFSNLSRPDTLRTEVIELGFSYDDAPNKVKFTLMAVLRGIEGILAEPRPVIRTVAYDSTVRYHVIFTVARQEGVAAAHDEFLTRAWYAARRQGLTPAFPTRRSDAGDQADLAAWGVARPAELLRRFPQFSVANDEALAGLDSKVTVTTYSRGERLISEGERLPGLYLILSGKASLLIRDAAGQEHEIAQVGQGEYFGESTLLSGQASEVSVTALEDLEVLVIPPEAVHTLVEGIPRLGREIGNVLDVRRKAAHAARRVKAISH